MPIRAQPSRPGHHRRLEREVDRVQEAERRARVADVREVQQARDDRDAVVHAASRPARAALVSLIERRRWPATSDELEQPKRRGGVAAPSAAGARPSSCSSGRRQRVLARAGTRPRGPRRARHRRHVAPAAVALRAAGVRGHDVDRAAFVFVIDAACRGFLPGRRRVGQVVDLRRDEQPRQLVPVRAIRSAIGPAPPRWTTASSDWPITFYWRSFSSSTLTAARSFSRRAQRSTSSSFLNRCTCFGNSARWTDSSRGPGRCARTPRPSPAARARSAARGRRRWGTSRSARTGGRANRPPACRRGPSTRPRRTRSGRR